MQYCATPVSSVALNIMDIFVVETVEAVLAILTATGRVVSGGVYVIAALSACDEMFPEPSLNQAYTVRVPVVVRVYGTVLINEALGFDRAVQQPSEATGLAEVSLRQ